MEMILYIILGAFIGWNFPQPGYAKWDSKQSSKLCKKSWKDGKR